MTDDAKSTLSFTPMTQTEIEAWRLWVEAGNDGFDEEGRYLATVDALRAENEDLMAELGLL